jgi:hypothetical protein
VISPTQKPLDDNTQHRQTDIQAPGGIQTHNPSKRAAADNETEYFLMFHMVSLVVYLVAEVAYFKILP